MPSPLSGPGVGLQLPQYLYPTELFGAPADISTNSLCLGPGDCIVIPAGDWYISAGFYAIIQYLDPITNTWARGNSAAYGGRGISFIKSDGFNVRLANLTGCPVSASVASYGTGGMTQATTTITAVPTGSTWLPIIGGQLLNNNAPTLSSAGAGYGVAPLVFIPAPAPAVVNSNGVGGTPASGYCVITSGTVSAFSFTNPGAGYSSPPIGVVLPSPYDPNLNIGITAATISFSLTGSGSLTGAICTNNGQAQPNGTLTVTLTVTGIGTGTPSLTANVMQTVVAASVTGPGVGYGTGAQGVITIGGAPATGSIVNPNSLHLAWLPRPAQILLTPANTSISVGSAGVIYDGGLFEGTPSAFLLQATGVAAPSTVASIGLQMGSSPDIVVLQPAP